MDKHINLLVSPYIKFYFAVIKSYNYCETVSYAQKVKILLITL